MSRNPRPGAKPSSTPATPDKQAATALDHLQRGRFRDAVECYKALVKKERRPEWVDGLAAAYEGRAHALADKAMRREAIALWRNRAEVCGKPLWEGPYVRWLVAEGQLADVVRRLASLRAAPAAGAASASANTGVDAAELEALLAPGVLAADAALCALLPPESLLAQHRASALAALNAYANADAQALDEALKSLSFRSPYRDLRLVLKALLLWETDREGARAAVDRLPEDSPFAALAAPLRCVSAPAPERWSRFARLSTEQQGIALDLLGLARAWAPALLAFAAAPVTTAPAALFDLLRSNAKPLPAEVATALWCWLAPWAKRSSCECPPLVGNPGKAQQELATALAVEIKGELDHAAEHWFQAVDLLNTSTDPGERLQAALVLRHVVEQRPQDSTTGQLKDGHAKLLLRSLQLDPSAVELHEQLARHFRLSGDLKKARERLDAGLALFPDNVALWTEAVETALASNAFKKAVGFAHRLLKIDPLNRQVRSRLGHAHLSHAGKHIALCKLDAARKEIEEAREWLKEPADLARLHLLQAWTAPEGSPERRRLAQAAVNVWGGGLAGGWHVWRELRGIDAKAKLAKARKYLEEAGVAFDARLTAEDVLVLVQALEREPNKVAKGPDHLLPWRAPLLGAATLPFDEATTARICEAFSRHQEHRLQETYANAGRKRWPDSPLLVYHAVAARLALFGGIRAVRDLYDLNDAQEKAKQRNDRKLVLRIGALIEADDPFGGRDDDLDDDFDDDLDDIPDWEVDGPDFPIQPQAVADAAAKAIQKDLRALLKEGGVDSILALARDSLQPSLYRSFERDSGGNRQAFAEKVINFIVEDVRLSSALGMPTIAYPGPKPSTKPAKPKKVAKPSAQGKLFDE